MYFIQKELLNKSNNHKTSLPDHIICMLCSFLVEQIIIFYIHNNYISSIKHSVCSLSYTKNMNLTITGQHKLISQSWWFCCSLFRNLFFFFNSEFKNKNSTEEEGNISVGRLYNISMVSQCYRNVCKRVHVIISWIKCICFLTFKEQHFPETTHQASLSFKVHDDIKIVMSRLSTGVW